MTYLVEFVGGPHDGTQARFAVLPVVFFVKEPPSVYRYSGLRPNGLYCYLHASLVKNQEENGPLPIPPDFS